MTEGQKIIALFSTLILIVIVLTLIWYKKGGNKLQQLREEYFAALRGTDKRAALEAGRRYYAELHNGYTTTYDEQVIGNDISTMKDVV